MGHPLAEASDASDPARQVAEWMGNWLTRGGRVLVDPQVLEAFAGEAGRVADDIKTADVGAKVETAADGLPGSSTQWAAHAVGQHFSQLVAQLADHVNKMGAAVRGAGDTYQVADDALARNFDELF